MLTRQRRYSGDRSRRAQRACHLRLETLEDRCLLSVDMVLRWNQVMIATLGTAGQSGVIATRSGAIVQAAVYEAVNAIDQTHTPYLVNIPAPTWASQEAAAAQAAHDTLVGLFPAQATVLGLQLRASLQGIQNGAPKTWGISVGHAAAQIMLAVRANDHSNWVVPYTPVNEPGRWRPTPPAFLPPTAPQWPYVIPFTLSYGSQFRPPSQPALTSPEYTRDFNEVKELGALDSATRTADQTEAALYWAGIVTPNAGVVEIFNQIAQQVAVDQGNTLAENARMLALLDLAQADAGIACWDAKYVYDFWRPITGIREADTDGNPDTEADPTWTPLLVTPPFPAYTSGHSCVTGASTAMLAAFFGTDAIPFSYSWAGLPGVKRSFASFSAAADEVGFARMWAGIHWSFDNLGGLTVGEMIAPYVFANFLRPRTGPAPGPGGGAGGQVSHGADVVPVLAAVSHERDFTFTVAPAARDLSANMTALFTPGRAEQDLPLRPPPADFSASTRTEAVERVFHDLGSELEGSVLGGLVPPFGSGSI